MFKQLFTLARGRSQDAAVMLMDANALSILRQQLREAATAVEQSRKSLAVVMAYAEQEKRRLDQTRSRIATLETRAIDALDKGHEELAAEAAEAIADLEAEEAATHRTVETYAAEIARLRTGLKESEKLLIDLKRGQRLAEANDKAIRLRGALPGMARTDLEEAAETLRRLQNRQEHATATAEAMVTLSSRTRAETLEDRLAEAGCGAPTKSDGAAVLERLKASRAAKPDN